MTVGSNSRLVSSSSAAKVTSCSNSGLAAPPSSPSGTPTDSRSSRSARANVSTCSSG
eukprot:CAMPEP_0194278190 /NCGR_PEP_ID=MMETSP0169-20130528/10311_1 /TAXON_ID=218684 /ORGANISM="Corethron pennatum, Strain L29A3" /LENGTH=56 /DNA_ID=CAMNT_0039022325 /DNA_START=125 /DNA_END=291 /DNA_ORIENTATION=-